MRIASLSPATTEILYLLGQQDLIVCTDQFSNFPEEAKQLPKLKDHQKVDPATLVEHEVDLVFTATVIQQKLAESLKTVGYSVVHHDPRQVHQIYDMIRNIGVLLQVEGSAEALITQMQQGFNDVKRKARLLPRRLRVYIEEWPTCASDKASADRHALPYASANWVPEVSRLAGCDQLPNARAGELSLECTLQQVADWNPDLVIISWCGAGSLADKELLIERSGWNALPAVQKRAVKVIDDSLLNRPGPRLVEGAQRLYSWAFEMLHS